MICDCEKRLRGNVNSRVAALSEPDQSIPRSRVRYCDSGMILLQGNVRKRPSTHFTCRLLLGQWYVCRKATCGREHQRISHQKLPLVGIWRCRELLGKDFSPLCFVPSHLSGKKRTSTHFTPKITPRGNLALSRTLWQRLLTFMFCTFSP